jgi:hypothetical protein
VVALAWVCALFLAVCGIGLVVAGFYAGVGGLVVGVVLGLFVGAGSVPFIRAARRMHRALEAEPLDNDVRRSRRQKIRAILGFSAVSCLLVLVLPAPGAVRVIGVVTVLLVVPVVLVVEFDATTRR